MNSEFEMRHAAARARYAGTMRTFAHNCVHRLPGWTVEDVVQELELKLWGCVQQYDPNLGASFNVLFQGVAKRKIINLIRDANAAMRKEPQLVYLDSEDVSEAVLAYRSEPSAEDWAIALLDHGDQLLSEMRRAA
jgi:DNA-directed RNA polymerase specialized sigma24 family protein